MDRMMIARELARIARELVAAGKKGAGDREKALEAMRKAVKSGGAQFAQLESGRWVMAKAGKNALYTYIKAGGKEDSLTLKGPWIDGKDDSDIEDVADKVEAAESSFTYATAGNIDGLSCNEFAEEYLYNQDKVKCPDHVRAFIRENRSDELMELVDGIGGNVYSALREAVKTLAKKYDPPKLSRRASERSAGLFDDPAYEELKNVGSELSSEIDRIYSLAKNLGVSRIPDNIKMDLDAASSFVSKNSPYNRLDNMDTMKEYIQKFKSIGEKDLLEETGRTAGAELAKQLVAIAKELLK